MTRFAQVSRSALLAAAVLVPSLLAHDSVDFMRAREAPFAPPLIVNAPGNGGFASSYSGTSGFPSSGVTLLSWLPLSAFGTHTTGADSWGYTSPSGREYAIMCLSDGIAWVEVTDPGLPVIIEVIPAVSSLWRDVKIYEDFAYYVSEGGDGIQIVDMSLIDAGIVTNVGSVNDGGTTASHNVAINEESGWLYQTGGGSDPIEGLRFYDLSNKANPSYAGQWNDRYVHDAQIVNWTTGPYAGKEIAFCFAEDESGGVNPAVDILDVTNKNNVQVIASYAYSNPVFSHQGWLSPDRQHLYINDELDEIFLGNTTLTRILDVSNLDAPFQAGTFTNGSSAVDHNLYTKDDLIFEANYRSGLRVYDATNPTSPVETAFFDTYPSDDGVDTNGLWNVYPYFDSGTIVGSDLERGLFLWRLGPPELTLVPTTVPDLLSPGGESIDVTISVEAGIALDASTPTLHVDSGSGYQTYPLFDQGGGTWQGTFPALACGQEVTWYASARTTAGTTWTGPAGAPTAVYGATAATSVVTVLEEDLESNPGWIVGASGDDATTGIWTRVDPIGTSAQPEDDHTPGGTDCFVTGQGFFGGGLGDDDVDDGKTTLRTNVFDLSGGDATIRYWRWYSNVAGGSPGADIFEVDISNNGGGSWSTVEVVGPTGDETVGGWYQHSFLVSDILSPTANMQMRFIASDEGDGSIVEAAVDDLEVLRFDCAEFCQTDIGFGGPGNATFSICGEELDTGNVATVTLDQAAPNALSVLFLSLGTNPVPFKGGTLVTLPILLDLTFSTDGSGTLTFPISGGGGPVTVYGQFAIADGSQPKGVALSNALEIVFGP
jgi:choice-of-anchor B domain-containing protein